MTRLKRACRRRTRIALAAWIILGLLVLVSMFLVLPPFGPILFIILLPGFLLMLGIWWVWRASCVIRP